ncbi:MAG: NAD-dependent epimerase/dehydratase family protein [Clostridiaceae bacterium]|jgi:dihydroflavonol-4-reductase|nr:NAD-dependent epimerase/dehydratase family protein [Clostridiaceae bacterium]
MNIYNEKNHQGHGSDETLKNDRQVWIVTGASGHLGNTIVQRLLSQGARVRALIIERERPHALKGLDCDVVTGNILDRKSLDALFAGLEDKEINLLHLASQISIFSGHDPGVFKVNVEGTQNMLDAAIAHGVHRFLYCSTVHAIPVPNEDVPITEIKHFDPDLVIGSYAKSKAIATQLVLDAAAQGLPAIIVQPVGIIGPYDQLQGHMTRLISRFALGRLPGMIRGTYNFADVRDIAEGAINATLHGRIGESYILSGHVTSIKDILNTVAELIGRKKIKRTVPLWLARIGAPIVESFSRLFNKPPLFTTYSLYTLQTPCRFSSEKAQRELGYSIRPLKETMRDTLLFMDRHQNFGIRLSLRPIPRVEIES